MKRRKIIGLLMAGAMVFGTLTACGNTASQGGESTDGAEQTAQTDKASEAEGGSEAPEGVQELSVTTWDNESSPQFQAIIDAYEEKNPDVKIKIIDTSADEYNNSLGISLSAAVASHGDKAWGRRGCASPIYRSF